MSTFVVKAMNYLMAKAWNETATGKDSRERVLSGCMPTKPKLGPGRNKEGGVDWYRFASEVLRPSKKNWCNFVAISSFAPKLSGPNTAPLRHVKVHQISHVPRAHLNKRPITHTTYSHAKLQPIIRIVPREKPFRVLDPFRACCT